MVKNLGLCVIPLVRSFTVLLPSPASLATSYSVAYPFKPSMSKNSQHLMTLKNLLGDDLFQDVIHIFAGDKIVFPKCPDHMEKEHRNRCIRQEAGQGVSIPDLMQKYDLSQSQIYKIIEQTP